MAALRPLMLGYLRDDLVDDPAGWVTVLTDAAAAAGFDLGEVFHERATDSGPIPPQFLALLDALRRTDAHVVAIPEGHLAGHAVPEGCLVNRLRDGADTRIHEVRVGAPSGKSLSEPVRG
ncbi:hypothetical protein BJY24_000395 [Nocardia transvalensis]|uniref:Resolvase-like protein n=1 Tax=Nocardia transvalensis TaxID=37333 RepID=A0A7W9P989_9NOCA|nr:hypothetical protein [Nocardia transvalensis]MBB5911528.1 hypothetical protein [Nocardia transvalensis]